MAALLALALGTLTAGGVYLMLRARSFDFILGMTTRKLVPRLQHLSFNGPYVATLGRSIRIVTERAVFELRDGALTLIEIAPGIDLAHDRQGRAQGQKIACDTLVLWGERGVVNRLFKPLALWQAQCAARVSGQAVPAGHFIPEELPELTAQTLRDSMC